MIELPKPHATFLHGQPARTTRGEHPSSWRMWAPGRPGESTYPAAGAEGASARSRLARPRPSIPRARVAPSDTPHHENTGTLPPLPQQSRHWHPSAPPCQCQWGRNFNVGTTQTARDLPSRAAGSPARPQAAWAGPPRVGLERRCDSALLSESSSTTGTQHPPPPVRQKTARNRTCGPPPALLAVRLHYSHCHC